MANQLPSDAVKDKPMDLDVITDAGDARRWNEVLRRSLSIHCNYIGGEKDWSVTEDDFATGSQRAWHGATPRAAMNAACSTPGETLRASRSSAPSDAIDRHDELLLRELGYPAAAHSDHRPHTCPDCGASHGVHRPECPVARAAPIEEARDANARVVSMADGSLMVSYGDDLACGLFASYGPTNFAAPPEQAPDADQPIPFAALREIITRRTSDSWAHTELENYLLRFDPVFRAHNPELAASFSARLRSPLEEPTP